MAKKKQKESSGRKSKAAQLELPAGVKLARTLRGHTGYIGRIAWSPDGLLLASSSG
jgi:WD40 repeat protein